MKAEQYCEDLKQDIDKMCSTLGNSRDEIARATIITCTSLICQRLNALIEITDELLIETARRREAEVFGAE